MEMEQKDHHHQHHYDDNKTAESRRDTVYEVRNDYD